MTDRVVEEFAVADRESALRWAIIGTGAISHHIAQDVTGLPGAELVAVASRDARRAGEFARLHGAAHAGSLSEVLGLGEVDVVYIATPHATHHEIARRALLAGKHVLIEKPATMDVAEAEDLRQLAQATHAFLMEAMWMKFNPAYRALIDFVRSGGIGAVRSVRASFGLPFPRDDSSRWNADLGGSALFDQGIYPLTLACDMLGAPTEITARGVREAGVDIAQHMTLEFGGGRYAQLASSMSEFVEPTAAVNGTDGWVEIPFPFWAATEFTTHLADPKTFLTSQTSQFEKQGNGYTPMLRAVQQAILDGAREHSLHTWSDTTAVLALLQSTATQIAQNR